MWRTLGCVVFSGALTLLAVACSGDDGSSASNFDPGGACTSQAECASGAYCKVDKCASCGCSAGQSCDAQGQCFSSSVGCDPACGSGEVCGAGGVCIPQGTCKSDQDCSGSAGLKCNLSEGKCVPGGECGEKKFTISAQTPNMLIALDRTGSMGGSVPNTGGKSRWEVAKEAVAQLLSTHAGKINFGLSLFSACTGNGCAPGIVNDPIGATGSAINQTVNAAKLCNSGDNETVIGGTLNGMVGEASLQATDRQNYILLITDGQDNCGGGGAAAATALLGQAVPVKTFVVGFSGDVDQAELTAIATAAGTAP